MTNANGGNGGIRVPVLARVEGEGGIEILVKDGQVTQMVSYTRSIGLFPSRTHLDAALDKIDRLGPATLACHHGTVKTGAVEAHLQAFRLHDVTGLTPADPVHTSISPPPPG
jgi:hypothetical protein